MEQVIISLISGAVGGNLAGAALKNQSLGTLGNSIAGLLGGGLGGQVLAMLGAGGGAAGGLDLTAIIGQVASGGVGGGVLMVIISLAKQVLFKR